MTVTNSEQPIVLIVIRFSPLVDAGSGGAKTSPRHAESMKKHHSSVGGVRINLMIGTWNVNRVLPKQVARMGAIAAWLSCIDADVWVLTETHDALSPGIGYSSVSTGQPDRAGEPGERWATIWSRLPVEPLPPTRDPARSVAALVKPGHGAPLVVYGTVLPWLGSRWRDFPAASGVAFRAALAAQLADWSDLVSRFPEADLCVLGDLNQDLSVRYHYGSRANRMALLDALATVGLSALTADPADLGAGHGAGLGVHRPHLRARPCRPAGTRAAGGVAPG